MVGNDFEKSLEILRNPHDFKSFCFTFFFSFFLFLRILPAQSALDGSPHSPHLTQLTLPPPHPPGELDFVFRLEMSFCTGYLDQAAQKNGCNIRVTLGSGAGSRQRCAPTSRKMAAAWKGRTVGSLTARGSCRGNRVAHKAGAGARAGAATILPCRRLRHGIDPGKDKPVVQQKRESLSIMIPSWVHPPFFTTLATEVQCTH